MPDRRARVALATCAEVPDLDEDGPALVGALADLGVEGVAAVWDAPDIDWAAFDLVVIRSTWDYAERRDRFVAWAHTLPGVLNPAPVVRWNTDKHYLRDLASAGVPVVPTDFVEPSGSFEPPDGRFVVKPAISAGARNSAAYDASQHERARAHVHELLAAGRSVMVQPYIGGVDAGGETALVYLGGAFSHAVRKGPLLRPGQPPGQGLYLEEEITAREPTPSERAVAERALAAVPCDGAELLYARVDLLPGPDGTPVLVELELTEPSLFLGVPRRRRRRARRSDRAGATRLVARCCLISTAGRTQSDPSRPRRPGRR